MSGLHGCGGRGTAAALGGSALLVAAALAAGTAVGQVSAASEGAPEVRLVSARPDGSAGSAQSGTFGLGISGDGGTVAFGSLATDLDSRDADRMLDVYAVRSTDGPRLVSIRPDGVKGNAVSTRPAVSGDGRYVAFTSSASNLHVTDRDSVSDVYVKDLDTGALVLASTAADGTKADGGSSLPALSEDGRFVAFISRAANLHAGDVDRAPDAYVKDLHTGEVRLVSVAADGTKPPTGPYGIGSVAISGDGTHVAFDSDAAGLDPHDVDTAPDIFVKDVLNGELVPASDGPGPGVSTSPSLSWSGHQVAFQTSRTDLHPLDVDEETSIYVRDIDSGALELASILPDGRGAGHRATDPSLSADGRHIAFAAQGPGLSELEVGQHLQVYVRDLENGQLVLASVAAGGAPADHLSVDPTLSGDGRTVAFATPSALTPSDGNGIADVYGRSLPDAGVPPVDAVDPGVAATAELGELQVDALPRALVTVGLTASVPDGAEESVVRLRDPSGRDRQAVWSRHGGAPSVEAQVHLLLGADELGLDPHGWTVEVAVVTEDGQTLVTSVPLTA